MAIAIIIGRDAQNRKLFSYMNEALQLLSSLQPGLDVRMYPDLGDYNEIDFVLAWRPPFGIFNQLPHLQCIASLGAGVDHLFADPQLPAHIPIVRIVDPAMSTDITQYVVAAVLYWLRRFDQWQVHQQQKIWKGSEPSKLDKTVGIMGLGFLGAHAAQALHALGVKVIGWGRSPKTLPGIQQFSGTAELPAFLSKADALVCLLPLTPETKHILNAENFACLPRGAYLLNLGRGDHLVEADLLAALDSGQLSGACLDVFREEPLPVNHPFWSHPHIRVTPHIAAITNWATALPQILENYRRIKAGELLINRVDRAKGY